MLDTTNPAGVTEPTDRMCLYLNGRFRADPAQWAGKWPRVYWIDVNGTEPHDASILDIETGDAQPSTILQWVPERLAGNPSYHCRLYCNLSTWPAVKATVARLTAAQQEQVRYWIANPTQAAHMVPGSDATQWGWFPDVDRSEVRPSWDA